ncbi:hypothetical protein K2X89_10100, partial [Myxococcota bacterium]|nr:hypothetical protein [Myxococcota bacterium]
AFPLDREDRMDRLTIVSCDGHAAAPPEVYRESLEAPLRARYDGMIASPEAVRRRAARVIGPFAPSGEGEREPLTERWDPVRRLAELDRDGLAAEVLFPQPAGLALIGIVDDVPASGTPAKRSRFRSIPMAARASRPAISRARPRSSSPRSAGSPTASSGTCSGPACSSALRARASSSPSSSTTGSRAW